MLTRDNYIRFRAVEVNALISGKVRAFVLTARGELNGAEIGEIFVKALPAMKKLCQTIPAPFVAHVHKDGTVTLMKSGSQ